MHLGIDEAGRGPVIGPLVVCGLMATESQIAEIEKLGAKDSKVLTPLKREELYKTLINFTHHVISISAAEIDARGTTSLNDVELHAMVEIAKKLKPEQVFIDCPSINQKAFTKQFESFVTGMKIVAEHKADAKYPVVSAASIIAKVTRDTEIERLKKVVGMDFGSGYPADPKTQEFLKNNWNNPDPKVQALFRKSWASFKTASQKKMDDYFA